MDVHDLELEIQGEETVIVEIRAVEIQDEYDVFLVGQVIQDSQVL